MTKLNTEIALTGGLGNQLFQFFAGLYLSKKLSSTLVIDSDLGKPSSRGGRANLFGFKLDSEQYKIVEKTRENTSMDNRSFNFLLTEPLVEKYDYLWSPAKATVRKFCKLILLNNSREYEIEQVFVSPTLGYCDLANISSNVFIVGYFQSYRYFVDLQFPVQNFTLHNDLRVSELDQLKSEAIETIPLVVHRRLGDYRNEAKFGLVSPLSYQNVIRQIWSLESNRSIWLFSDEPESAIEVIPDELRIYVKKFEDVGEHPAITLEKMRMGFSYVLANSSLSFWAAMLSYNVLGDKVIYAPKPWFKSVEDPSQLIPNSWARYSSKFEVSVIQ